MEDFELSIDDDEFDDASVQDETDADVDNLLQELVYPWSKDEPSVPADELQRLDAVADRIEMNRLQKMRVMRDPSALMDTARKTLSTRFVRKWRPKTIDGVFSWLRRSRFVAREFAWLDDSKESLFSPASSAISYRVIPMLFLKNQASWGLRPVDIKDAFLTVDQKESTMVYAQDASSRTEACALGKVLPGQRGGSMLWHESLTQH